MPKSYEQAAIHIISEDILTNNTSTEEALKNRQQQNHASAIMLLEDEKFKSGKFTTAFMESFDLSDL